MRRTYGPAARRGSTVVGDPGGTGSHTGRSRRRAAYPSRGGRRNDGGGDCAAALRSRRTGGEPVERSASAWASGGSPAPSTERSKQDTSSTCDGAQPHPQNVMG